MNILIVCGEYFNKSNGLSLSTQRFVEQFKRLGDEVRVLSSDHGGESEYSVPVMHVPLVDGIMDRQNYHFAKSVGQVSGRPSPGRRSCILKTRSRSAWKRRSWPLKWACPSRAPSICIRKA